MYLCYIAEIYHLGKRGSGSYGAVQREDLNFVTRVGFEVALLLETVQTR